MRYGKCRLDLAAVRVLREKSCMDCGQDTGSDATLCSSCADKIGD